MWIHHDNQVQHVCSEYLDLHPSFGGDIFARLALTFFIRASKVVSGIEKGCIRCTEQKEVRRGYTWHVFPEVKPKKGPIPYSVLLLGM